MTAAIGPLGPMQVRAMKELATYTLLTVDLARQAGVGADRSRISEAFAGLVRRKLVGVQPGKFVPGLGELSSIYWLTIKGADLLHELTGIEAQGARRRLRWLNEGAHRLDIVRVHLALRLWAASARVTVKDVWVDFEPGSPRLGKVTTIRWVDRETRENRQFPPDAIAQVNLAGGVVQLLALEIERGGSEPNGDLSKFWKKLPRIRAMIEHEAVEWTFKLPHAARIVIVFRTEAMRRRALKEWPDPDAEDWEVVYIKSYDELAPDFNAGWWDTRGRQRPLFAHHLPA